MPEAFSVNTFENRSWEDEIERGIAPQQADQLSARVTYSLLRLTDTYAKE